MAIRVICISTQASRLVGCSLHHSLAKRPRSFQDSARWRGAFSGGSPPRVIISRTLIRACLLILKTSPYFEGWLRIVRSGGHPASITTTTLYPKSPTRSYLHFIMADAYPSAGSSLWRCRACFRCFLCTRECIFEILTVGFHNFNLRIFNLRISNPKQSICVCFFDTMSDFNAPGPRPKKHYEISETDCRGVQSISAQACLEPRVNLTRSRTHESWGWVLSPQHRHRVRNNMQLHHSFAQNLMWQKPQSCSGRGIMVGSDLTLLPLPIHACFTKQVATSLHQLYPQLALATVQGYCSGYPPLHYS